MNTQRVALVVVGVLCALTFLSFVGCSSDTIDAKSVVIKNNSEISITRLSINQAIVVKSDATDNILADGESLDPGESLTAYITPYVQFEDTTLTITYPEGTSFQTISNTFAYDYLVDGEHEPLVATFTAEGLTITGSNIELVH